VRVKHNVKKMKNGWDKGMADESPAPLSAPASVEMFMMSTLFVSLSLFLSF